MSLPKAITITEVGSRDGFQSIKNYIDPQEKIAMVKNLIDAGAKSIELTSFVNPKWVPQFADAAEVFNGIKPYADEKGVELIALVPNLKGAQNAKAAGVEIINLVISASEEHNKRNVNKTIEESLQELKNTVEQISDVEIRLAIACVFGSPFRDEVPYERVQKICKFARDIGIRFLGLGDSAGVSTPTHTAHILSKLVEEFGADDIGLHLHDTRGMGMANAFVAMKLGITNFDASFGALGGCPFIPGAKGNIGTEDLVNMVHGMGIDTGFDFEKLMTTVFDMEKRTSITSTSSMAGCMKKQ